VGCGIAAVPNACGIRTARSGKWAAIQVRDIYAAPVGFNEDPASASRPIAVVLLHRSEPPLSADFVAKVYD
jgi:hypothetical protein